jgi:pimeloyl-ACP methyl ester carboxylesterase
LEKSGVSVMPDLTELPEPLKALEARQRSSSFALHGLTWRVLDTAAESQADPCPVVMLPGALGSHKIFYRQWEFLRNAGAHRRLVLVDYPGSSDIQAMTGGFEQLLTLLHVDRAVFVGSSLGACWLQIFTSSGNRQLTQRVEHLLVGNTFVDAEPLQKSPLFARTLVNDKPAAEVKKVFHDFVTGLPECELRTVQLAFMAEQSADDLANRLKMVANAGVIPSSSVPQDRMTILTCDDDGVTTQEIAGQICRAYPQARHVAFTSGGHYPHVNRPQQYNMLLADILRF